MASGSNTFSKVTSGRSAIGPGPLGSAPVREPVVSVDDDMDSDEHIGLSTRSESRLKRSAIVSAAIENEGDRVVPFKGTLDRGTLAQCLNATSQIATECNSLLRDLLRGRYVGRLNCPAVGGGFHVLGFGPR